MELQTMTPRRESTSSWTSRWYGVLSHTHTYSGKSDHGGTVRPPESYQKLAEWAAGCGIAALGMGSPYTPKSAQTYGRYDETHREQYYSPGFDHRSAMDLEEIQQMLKEIAQFAGGRTLFYLDNETPKGRYGHMWWLGHHPDKPAWHDYDQPYDRWMLNHTKAGDHADEPIAYERRAYLEILSIQRSHGALGFWAHPTSWWPGDAGQFVTNIASEMPAHCFAQGFLDGVVVMGYHPFRPQYQAIWLELLDRGYRAPGIAEMDVGLSDSALWRRTDPMLTYAPRLSEPVTLQELVTLFRAGRTFVSNGPMVDIAVDGHHPGQIVRTGAGSSHHVRITAHPKPGQPPLGRVELLGRKGNVLWANDKFGSGTVEVSIPGSDERGYVIARAFGPEASPNEWRRVRQFALCNPVYLHPSGQGFERPMTTNTTLTIAADSPFADGEVRFESFSGDLLSSTRATGEIHEQLPADGRITLIGKDGRRKMEYLVNANRAVQDVQRYLYRGRFLLDHPQVQSGDLPVEAWRLDSYKDAMRQARLSY